MPDDALALRIEANSIDPILLSESQLVAFKQIVASIYEVVTDLKDQKPQEERTRTSRIDDDRKSRTMMISGDRGTGKTTLMLTLQHLLTEDNSDGDDRILGEICNKQINTIRNRVIWLDPLDMEHSSEETNLFVSILARVDEALKPCFRDPTNEIYPYFNSVGQVPGKDDVLMELRRLQVDASLAWEGNLVARAPSLDADAYATEVMRAEQARMGLNKRFRKLLDDIATKLRWEPNIKSPIFILAVDDFDLNPSRCLDILKLLRSLNVPRLFTLVLGDEDVAEEVFRLKIQGQMSRIANVTIDAHNGASSSFIGRIKHISPQAVRKLVPPHQRLKLRHNTIEESLRVRPKNSSSTLGKILKSLHLDDTRRKTRNKTQDQSLYHFLVNSVPSFMTSPELDDKASVNLQRQGFRYLGGRILETSLREIVDLWYSVKAIVSKDNENSLKKQTKRERLIENVRTWVRKAVYDDTLIDLRSAEEFIYEFERDSDQALFRCYHLDLQLPLPRGRKFSTNAFNNSPGNPFNKLSINYIDEFNLVYCPQKVSYNLDIYQRTTDQDNTSDLSESDSMTNQKIASVPLSIKTQSHLVLLHDLIASNPHEDVAIDSLVKPIGEYGIVSCDWKLPGIPAFIIPWRGAVFGTVRELEIFANCWDLYVEELRKLHLSNQRPSVDSIGFSWFVLNLAISLGEPKSKLEGLLTILPHDERTSESTLLEDLLKEVVDIANAEARNLHIDWVINGLLANICPASGLSIEFCKRVLNVQGVRELYESRWRSIKDIQLNWLDKNRSASCQLDAIFYPSPSTLDFINEVNNWFSSQNPRLDAANDSNLRDGSDRDLSAKESLKVFFVKFKDLFDEIPARILQHASFSVPYFQARLSYSGFSVSDLASPWVRKMERELLLPNYLFEEFNDLRLQSFEMLIRHPGLVASNLSFWREILPEVYRYNPEKKK
jgi:hypothetical protein